MPVLTIPDCGSGLIGIEVSSRSGATAIKNVAQTGRGTSHTGGPDGMLALAPTSAGTTGAGAVRRIDAVQGEDAPTSIDIGGGAYQHQIGVTGRFVKRGN